MYLCLLNVMNESFMYFLSSFILPNRPSNLSIKHSTFLNYIENTFLFQYNYYYSVKISQVNLVPICQDSFQHTITMV